MAKLSRMKSFTHSRWCSISCSISALITKFNIVIVVHELIANVLSTEDEEERERKKMDEIVKHLLRQKIGKKKIYIFHHIGKTISFILLSLLEGWRVCYLHVCYFLYLSHCERLRRRLAFCESEKLYKFKGIFAKCMTKREKKISARALESKKKTRSERNFSFNLGENKGLLVVFLKLSHTYM